MSKILPIEKIFEKIYLIRGAGACWTGIWPFFMGLKTEF
jgi:hypothetical protein